VRGPPRRRNGLKGLIIAALIFCYPSYIPQIHRSIPYKLLIKIHAHMRISLVPQVVRMPVKAGINYSHLPQGGLCIVS
jgi:hypothetical protein